MPRCANRRSPVSMMLCRVASPALGLRLATGTDCEAAMVESVRPHAPAVDRFSRGLLTRFGAAATLPCGTTRGLHVPYYSLDDEGFWAIGPESLEWMRVVAEAIDVKFARFPLGDPEDENTPFASVLSMPPNYELWRHKHDCFRFEAIIKGSIRVGDRVLGPGD